MLHLATDAGTGQVLAWELTASTRCRRPDQHGDGLVCDCPHVGDASVAEKLLHRLAAAGVVVDVLVADGAYSGAPLRNTTLTLWARVVAPLLCNAAYNPSTRPGTIDRNRQVMAERHLGPAEWKRRVGYHVRSSVEADIGAFKQVMGEKVRAKKFDRARVEIGVKIGLRNAWLAA